ncbi:MAG: hypothetical protein JKP92_06340 [Alphaproteobacteria bacterium]|jgi:uncharacterized protein YciI|nr:hypothetical protein [Alphaproteobacteria bacterium]
MQFLIIAHDGTDPEAADRRAAARPAHIARGDAQVRTGEQVFGAALLCDEGEMIGSVMVVEAPDRAALDAWLAAEPYVTGDVWRDIQVTPCRVGPSFAEKA